jgi:nucleoside phosphorylase
MASKNLTHNDYTVGWVCALSKEQTAATAMLDEEHEELHKPPNDHNSYTLGRIGKHNIVIACLPEGEIGNDASAAVATRMTSTFPSVKFGLMVGIGGGVPPTVRLGDVVVSTPGNGFGGVVQWDIGKTEQGNTFKRTGALDSPPNALRTALTKLKTKHEMKGSLITQYLEDLAKKWPRLGAKYAKCDTLEDVLFKANYNHVQENSTESRDDMEVDADEGDKEEDSEKKCISCDPSKAINRKPRDMIIHYGLIASGNQVIKDAAFRDEINKRLGGHVLCFEMEAAGLMNDFPCIVIRGICDYADSHKNKDWQEYAAAVAAAFAKEFLSVLPAHEVDQLPLIKSTRLLMSIVSSTLVE